jgi:hypothetical protein
VSFRIIQAVLPLIIAIMFAPQIHADTTPPIEPDGKSQITAVGGGFGSTAWAEARIPAPTGSDQAPIQDSVGGTQADQTFGPWEYFDYQGLRGGPIPMRCRTINPGQPDEDYYCERVRDEAPTEEEQLATQAAAHAVAELTVLPQQSG